MGDVPEECFAVNMGSYFTGIIGYRAQADRTRPPQLVLLVGLLDVLDLWILNTHILNLAIIFVTSVYRAWVVAAATPRSIA